MKQNVELIFIVALLVGIMFAGYEVLSSIPSQAEMTEIIKSMQVSR